MKVCKECFKSHQRECYKKNRKKKLKKNKEWRNKNPRYSTIYTKNRLKSDPVYRACYNARQRVRAFLKGKNKTNKSMGCSYEEFKVHIESQFQPGMNWTNYGSGPGKWNVDHKYPLSLAYLEGRTKFSESCHYSNLQPMWSSANLSKNNKIVK